MKPSDMARMTLAEIEQVASRLAAALEVIRSAQGAPTPQPKPAPNWRIVGGSLEVKSGLGAKVRAARIAAGYSQQTLAKSAGLAIATVVVLETQDKASARTLEKIGAVLGSPPEAP